MLLSVIQLITAISLAFYAMYIIESYSEFRRSFLKIYDKEDRNTFISTARAISNECFSKFSVPRWFSMKCMTYLKDMKWYFNDNFYYIILLLYKKDIPFEVNDEKLVSVENVMNSINANVDKPDVIESATYFHRISMALEFAPDLSNNKWNKKWTPSVYFKWSVRTGSIAIILVLIQLTTITI